MALERKWSMLDDLNMSENTKITYKRSFNKLFSFCSNESEQNKPWFKLNSYDYYLGLSDDSLQEMLENFLDHEKGRVKANLISPNSIPNYFSAYKILLEANYREHSVKWKPIVLKYPPMEKRSGYKPWTTPQINQMLGKCATLKKEAEIYFQASTGSRVGIHDHPLLMKHMIKMEHPDLEYHCYAFLIYAEEDETIEEKDQRILNDDRDSSDYSFFAFSTPEASYVLDQYHIERKEKGEVFVANTPIFRGSDTHACSTGEFYQITGNAFRKMMEALVVTARVERVKKRNRFDTMIDHGFRKRFNTVLKINNDVNSNIAEKLMQHAKGLDGTYLTPTRQQCFDEFVKAIPELTLSEVEKKKMENQLQKDEITELKEKNEILEAQNKEIKDLKQRQIEFEQKWMEKSFPGIEK